MDRGSWRIESVFASDHGLGWIGSWIMDIGSWIKDLGESSQYLCLIVDWVGLDHGSWILVHDIGSAATPFSLSVRMCLFSTEYVGVPGPWFASYLLGVGLFTRHFGSAFVLEPNRRC